MNGKGLYMTGHLDTEARGLLSPRWHRSEESCTPVLEQNLILKTDYSDIRKLRVINAAAEKVILESALSRRVEDRMATIQEDLIELILLRERGHQPALKQEIRDFAESMASANDRGDYLGKNWVNRFFDRHPEV
ncbi:hypothetical protein FOXG_21976 [Fusarium oxysporum f. sp. lycopersici 4287]|uniref:HTH CENPB-type domain-containing protein n=1 Tax=Fusarium oxysporum f. sp. lycopersici (strain 4287 / CBS 123668 / FGSC 9935 / NRRL 34936) TaxID=426428 RepID=A0A0J9W3W5_FUSO4|nr:hypothetical protein FOXG_21710 [Fusarium oxysporum f. sp. lycopersici 4287]XP_018255633.1 hypothetical protein FOXG_21976 [Fusarium oxysporum f. sp. lycopersici 4287]KNB16566.1 hypothetical protein FOXG_21710 [Fusarium oxysporum f. sp. lycopersici 4287]KNB17588.1 hypothetical protein FOXG_21976 [Fusarium oxysporum f. sp. lycopersici 4287]